MNVNHDRARDDVPEPFLWFLLYRLMRACTEMEKIRSIPGGAYKLIHQDIKLQNVFLGRPNHGHYPLYPLGKIGDFGSARIFTGAHQATAGEDAMTWGWIAPEYFNDNFAGGAITPAANTWGAARIILNLIQPYGVADNPSAVPADATANLVASFADEDDGVDPDPAHPHDRVGVEGRQRLSCSKELIQVVRGCLAHYPRNRYAPGTVMAYIRANEARFLAGMGDNGVVSVAAGRR
ncbi:hypothetical protein BDV97DRAFT_424225, partial [Delphinella strobiligena]